MTEKQILKKIEMWDEQDKIAAIIDFIENLPIEQKTALVLSELGRAYNNAYWLNPSDENKKYLKKAVDVFNYLKGDIDAQSWHYRIGYAYFFLDDIAKAKEHLQQTSECNAVNLLGFIAFAEKKGLKPTQVAPQGMMIERYALEKFVDLLTEKAPRLASTLTKGVSDVELDQFEQRIGAKLPESFRWLHKTFSGQTDNSVLFFNNSQRFVALSEIESLQNEWLAQIERHFGANWQKQKLSSDDFFDDDIIKNQLFSKKWIPFLTRMNEAGFAEYLCFDLDPVNQENYGQIISVSPGEDAKCYFVDWVEYGLAQWINPTLTEMENGGIYYDEALNSLMFANSNERSFEPAFYEEDEQTALEDYITTKIGKFDDVFHELVSPDIHCDVYLVKPTPERNYYTLVTGGMGAFDMFTPDGYEGSSNIELMIHLPPTWDVNSQDEKDYWPIRWLKLLARLPIEQATYLGWGHTIPSGERIEGTNFAGFMLISTETEGKPAQAKLPGGKTVEFFTLVPIYEEEMLFKLENGAEGLLELFEENQIPYPPVVDVRRPNVCEGFQPAADNGALDNVAWAFNKNNYAGLMQFWEEVKAYNDDIENDLEYFNPFATIFNTPKVKVIYEAWLRSEKDLFSIEKLTENPADVFQEGNDEDGYYQTEVIAELESGDGKVFGALELLWNIQNCLQNKELGDHIYFEGFEIEGYSEDGTPILFLHLGS